MSPKTYLFVIIAAVLIGLAINSFFQTPELQLINLNPKTLELEENDRKPFTFQIQNNKNKTFEKIRVTPEIKNTNGNFLKIDEFKYSKSLSGEKATSEEGLSIYAYAVKSEGNELQYLVDFTLFADDNDKKHNQETTIKITPNPLRTLIRITPSLFKEIEFIDLNPRSIILKEFGDAQAINFRIQNNVNDEIKDIKVQPYVYNSSGKYLEMTGFDFTETLSGTGQTTGTKSIKMSVKDSEGIKLKYHVYFDLYGNGKIMDSQMVEVIIEPQ